MSDPPGTALTVDARVWRGSFVLDVAFSVEAGEVVGVLGPNGSGKSTLLKALAGLIPVAAGRLVLAGTVVDDAQTRQFAEPAGRPVGLVFQDYRLFASRRPCPAGRRSGSRSPGHSPASPNCCCSTSRSPRSTPARGLTSNRSFAGTWPLSPAPACS